MGSFLITTGTLLLFLAFNLTLASIASPITSSFTVIAVGLALIFLKEKLSLKNWFGLILVLISVFGLAFINP